MRVFLGLMNFEISWILRSASLPLHDYKNKLTMSCQAVISATLTCTRFLSCGTSLTIISNKITGCGRLSARRPRFTRIHPSAQEYHAVSAEVSPVQRMWLFDYFQSLKLGYSARFCNGHICFVSGIVSVLNPCMCVGEKNTDWRAIINSACSGEFGFPAESK